MKLVLMAPHNRRLLPLLLLLFFLLYSLSSLFLSPSTPNPPQIQSPLHSLPASTTLPPNFTFLVKVLTFNRLSSLSRCLNSLSRAHYDAHDKVHLHIYIDHFLQDSRSGPADLEQRLNISKQILDFVDGFEWRFGDKLVHYRTSNAGLQAQWLEAWWPASDHEFAFVVEDDLELSPLYYRFLKAVILNYYYNSTNYSPSIYGASLQRPRFVPGKHGNKMQLDGEARVFLYQLVGTWGQLLFPRPWKEFRLWYDMHKSKGMKPLLDGMVTTGWYKKMGEKIWTPWFIKFIHSRGYFNVYTNFLHERALSVSHRDAGVNYGKTAGPDSYLLDENSVDPNFLELHPLKDLKWYDFCFRQVVTDRIVRSSNEIESVLQSVQRKKSVLLVSLYRVPETVVRNMLCNFEGMNINNYVLIGPASDFLRDLARRGHAVIDATNFSDFSKLSKSVTFHDSTLELLKEILVMASVTRKNLELGYTTWLLDANMLPRNNGSFLDTFDRTNDLYVGSASRLMFVRSSSSMLKTWGDDLPFKIASMVESLGKPSDSAPIFFHAVEKVMGKESFEFKSIDEMHLGQDLGSVHGNSSFDRGSKFIIWASDTELDVLQKQLGRLGLWFLDGDSSCSSVVCHPL